jgi:hypothetical protein
MIYKSFVFGHSDHIRLTLLITHLLSRGRSLHVPEVRRTCEELDICSMGYCLTVLSLGRGQIRLSFTKVMIVFDGKAFNVG